jgi:hypothetical protein
MLLLQTGFQIRLTIYYTNDAINPDWLYYSQVVEQAVLDATICVIVFLLIRKQNF